MPFSILGLRKSPFFPWLAIGCIGLFLMFSLIFLIIGAGIYERSKRDPAGYGGVSGGGSIAYPTGIDPQVIASKINDYIKKKIPTSPLVNSGLDFAQAGQKWNVNPALMMAIAYQESKFGTAGDEGMVAKNPFGWGPHQKFDSWEESIWYVTEKMRQNYLNKGFDTIEKIQKKYCPVGASNNPNGLNENWLDGVNKSFNDILSNIPELRVVAVGKSGNIVAIAQQELDAKVRESGENRGAPEKYGAGKGQPWCAAFVSWVYTQAGYSMRQNTADAMWDFFGKSPHRYTTAPAPGDVIFFTYDHVAIVESISGDIINYIGGNQSDAVSRGKIKIGSAKIKGFGRW